MKNVNRRTLIGWLATLPFAGVVFGKSEKDVLKKKSFDEPNFPSQSEVKYLKNMQAIHTEPGDVIVFKCPANTTQEQKHHIAEISKHLFPHSEVLLLTDGIEIGVIGKK